MRRSCTHALLGALVALAALTAHGADSTPGIDTAETQLRQTSEDVLDLFRDSSFSAAENTDALVKQLHTVLDPRFDWVTMAKWVLGTHRSAFNQEQTEAFADLFSDYVVLYYLSQVEEYVIDESANRIDEIKMEFRDARKRRDGAVAMDVIFITPGGTEVQTGYTLVYDDAAGQWQIRNFIVEGISLVRNWRTELARVRSRDAIMQLLRDKVEQLRGERLKDNGEDEQ